MIPFSVLDPESVGLTKEIVTKLAAADARYQELFAAEGQLGHEPAHVEAEKRQRAAAEMMARGQEPVIVMTLSEAGILEEHMAKIATLKSAQAALIGPCMAILLPVAQKMAEACEKLWPELQRKYEAEIVEWRLQPGAYRDTRWVKEGAGIPREVGKVAASITSPFAEYLEGRARAIRGGVLDYLRQVPSAGATLPVRTLLDMIFDGWDLEALVEHHGLEPAAEPPPGRFENFIKGIRRAVTPAPVPSPT